METRNVILRWRPTNAPLASSRTDDIWFIDPSVGWAVNSNGQILKTTDGGDHWTQQFQDQVYLRCVGFANTHKGWVGTLTRDKRMFHTPDGGETWSLVTNLPATSPVAICGLAVVNESVIFASGTNYPNQAARMIKSTDGGETWTGWDMAEHATLLVDTYFISPARGWVVGGKADPGISNPTRDDVKPVVLFTADGGATWENRVESIQSSLPLGEWGWKIQFLNEQVGFVSLENFQAGAILKTTDGGQTWTRIPVNDPQGNANLEGVGFIDENTGWVGGWGDALFSGGFSSETTDGGEQWLDANEIGRFINRFRFFGDPVTVGYASGKTVYKYSTDPVPAALAATVGPLKFLRANEPAEFTNSVEIAYVLPKRVARVAIDIWDRFGEHVCRLGEQVNPADGDHAAVWEFTNHVGDRLPRGPYIYRLTVDGNAESRLVFKK